MCRVGTLKIQFRNDFSKDKFPTAYMTTSIRNLNGVTYGRNMDGRA